MAEEIPKKTKEMLDKEAEKQRKLVKDHAETF